MFYEIKLRKPTEEEVTQLAPTDPVYVEPAEFEGDETYPLILVEGHVTNPAAEGGFYPVTTIFGAEVQSGVDGIYVPDKGGEPVHVVRQEGTHFDLSLLFPKIAPEEVRERVFAALREEFGAGLISIVKSEAVPFSAIKYDVHEQVTVVTGRGKTRQVDEVLTPLAEGVYHPEALALRPKSGKFIVSVHKPKTRQMPTI